ncbi:MAG TPA: tetratricopeptide repeat protein, partial [Gammaproteobacteria bacterium]|nr:tetratricopeptide repeat protein [Gammaproteobacteria bacterium]
MMNKIIAGFLTVFVVWSSVVSGGIFTDSEYVEKAQDYLDQGKLKAASIELRNALQQNQENAQARRMLGKVYLELGNPVSAEKELRRASELGVADGAVLPLLVRALLAQGKLDELQVLSLDNLTTNNQKAAVLAAQGLGKLIQGEVDRAEEKIDQAVSLDHQSTYVGVAKARLLATKQEYDLAREELGRAFVLDADYAPAWSLLGDLEGRDKNLTKSEEAYTKAIESRTDNLIDLVKRALVRTQQKKYEEAQKDIDVLKKRVPQNVAVNFTQGLIYFQNNRMPEAREAFNLTLRANNNHLQAMYYLSLTHLRLGNREQAENYARQFLTVVPGSISGRKLMASIKLGNRQYTLAEELIRPVVASREDDVEAIGLLANSLLKQNKMV